MFFMNARYLAKIGMLSAIATILMFFEVPLPMMPVFLKLDISDLPAIIAAFLYGPMAGVLIEFIKNVLHGINSQTMGIGEVANFLVGIAFILPAGFLYKGMDPKNSAVIALLSGTISMVIFASLLNYFVLLPMYQSVLHFPLDQIIQMGNASNPAIVDLKSFIALAIAPFNFIKGLCMSIFTLVLYRKLQNILA